MQNSGRANGEISEYEPFIRKTPSRHHDGIFPVAQFNVLWLNPNNHDTFPAGLIEALTLHGNVAVVSERHGDSIQSKMKQQMRADALQPLYDDSLEEQGPVVPNMKSSSVAPEDQFTPEILEEATQFLRLQVR